MRMYVRIIDDKSMVNVQYNGLDDGMWLLYHSPLRKDILSVLIISVASS
jgi:hypothetical protein